MNKVIYLREIGERKGGRAEGMANLEDVGVGHGDDRSAVVLRSCGPFHLWVGGGCECEVGVQGGLMVWGVYAEEEGGGVHAKGDLLVERSRPVVLHLASLCWNKNR